MERAARNLQKAIGSQLILHEFKTAGTTFRQCDRRRMQDASAQIGDRVLSQNRSGEGITLRKIPSGIKDQFIVAALRQKTFLRVYSFLATKSKPTTVAHGMTSNWRRVKLQMIVLKQDEKPESASAKTCEEIHRSSRRKDSRDGSVYLRVTTKSIGLWMLARSKASRVEAVLGIQQ